MRNRYHYHQTSKPCSTPSLHEQHSCAAALMSHPRLVTSNRLPPLTPLVHPPPGPSCPCQLRASSPSRACMARQCMAIMEASVQATGGVEASCTRERCMAWHGMAWHVQRKTRTVPWLNTCSMPSSQQADQIGNAPTRARCHHAGQTRACEGSHWRLRLQCKTSRGREILCSMAGRKDA